MSLECFFRADIHLFDLPGEVFMKNPETVEELYSYLNLNQNSYHQVKETHTASSDKLLTLYHGSKSGLHGAIAPISRDRCDFGKGFYMGTDYTQPLTLICNYPNAKIYILNVDLSGLKILDLGIGLDWALFVAYNRGKMELAKDSQIYKNFANLSTGYDMVIGYIANDRMFVVLDRFFNGEITDLALINCLSVLKLGKQYVALTKKACAQINISEERKLSEEDRGRFKKESAENRAKGIAMADDICKKYRREGRFFDELLKAGE